jgi:hypothetical protein
MTIDDIGCSERFKFRFIGFTCNHHDTTEPSQSSKLNRKFTHIGTAAIDKEHRFGIWEFPPFFFIAESGKRAWETKTRFVKETNKSWDDIDRNRHRLIWRDIFRQRGGIILVDKGIFLKSTCILMIEKIQLTKDKIAWLESSDTVSYFDNDSRCFICGDSGEFVADEEADMSYKGIMRIDFVRKYMR